MTRSPSRRVEWPGTTADGAPALTLRPVLAALGRQCVCTCHADSERRHPTVDDACDWAGAKSTGTKAERATLPIDRSECLPDGLASGGRACAACASFISRC